MRTESEPSGSVRFYLKMQKNAKKCENWNNSATSDRINAYYSSLESSHRDASNDGKIKSLASIHQKLSHDRYILKN